MVSLRGLMYRAIMRIAHKYNWHYAPPIYPDGDTQLWCKWCGFSQTIKRRQNLSPIWERDVGHDDPVGKLRKEWVI